jgi:uncharacterized protein YcbK (DUF882 family)
MINRRDYLSLLGRSAAVFTAALGGVAVQADPSASASSASAAAPMAAPLWMSRNGEEFFFDAYSPRGYATASYLLRDVQANVIGRPDPWVLRAMSQMQAWWASMGHHVRLDATSGLRISQTNNHIEGAAQASRHLPGPNLIFDAVDFRPGRVDIAIAAQWARAAGISGLGLYTQRNFLHIDRGRVRQWGR